MAFPLAMNVNPSTLGAVITDLVDSLVAARHSQDRAAQQPRRQRPEAAAARAVRQDAGSSSFSATGTASLGRRVPTRSSTHPDDHAGEMETSFVMAYYPHLVGPAADGTLNADEGRTAATRFEAVNRGWVSITRPWHLLTTNSGAGNPHAATAEKGRRADGTARRAAGRLSRRTIRCSG